MNAPGDRAKATNCDRQLPTICTRATKPARPELIDARRAT
jgi:hypothetical protein